MTCKTDREELEQCALGAYGIGPGDEVIVPALTWYATAMAVHYVGGKPILVDIALESLCIDPDKVEGATTARTKAIVPVHLYSSASLRSNSDDKMCARAMSANASYPNLYHYFQFPPHAAHQIWRQVTRVPSGAQGGMATAPREQRGIQALFAERLR